MARNKAIFDADILIHLCKTGSLEKIINCFEQIFISDYVYLKEIKEGTNEKQNINKLINTGKIKILYFQKLTSAQQKIYKEAYDTLKNQTSLGFINEGERITASYANAYKVSYYMSDDNKAAPYIRSLTSIEVINFCDLLFITLMIDRGRLKELKGIYDSYILLYDKDKIPNILKNSNGKVKGFAEMMAYCKSKFDKNQRLLNYLQLFISI